MPYSFEERARARSTIRRLQTLALDAKTASMRGVVLPTEAEKAILGLTHTAERSRQIVALQEMSERLQVNHLGKLKPLAKDEFNAFCEYVSPEEPPESKWHIFLTDTLQKIECEPGYERFVLNCPPGVAKPLSVETQVMMGDGALKRLGDIRVGDTVITHTGQARSVEAVHDQGKLECLKLTTEQGREIITAPDHSFYVLPKVKRGDPDVTPLPGFVAADKLRIGSQLVLPPKHAFTDTSERSPALFTFAAHWSATGSQRSQHTHRNKFFNAYFVTKNIPAAAEMRRNLDTLGFPHTGWVSQGAATRGLIFIRLNTQTVKDLWADIGPFSIPAYARKIPPFVFLGGQARIKQFIESYILTRGDIPKRFQHPQMHIRFASRVMARQFRALLARFAVPSRVVDTGSGLQGSAKLILEHAEVVTFLEAGFTYTGSNPHRLEEKLSTSPAVPPAALIDRVIGIEHAGKQPCKCLSVAQDHTFLAEGVAVHNSTYASRLFVAWRMGRRPRDKIIGGSHSQRFVENEFSKKIRNIVGGNAYRDIFPNVVIDAATRAADQWALAGTGGQYVAKGAGQAIHGFRANFVCIDDPYPKIEAAESPTERAKVEVWFFGDVGSRLLPGAVVFVIMTRFHEEDLTGAIQKVNPTLAPNMRYRILEVPAICYDPENDIMGRKLGEVLWDYYGLEYYADKRATWSFQRYSLVYQQNTYAADDASIASKFQFYKLAPHQTEEAFAKAKEKGQVDPLNGRTLVNRRDYYRRIVASVDTASKKTERADYTVIQIWAETDTRKYYLLASKRGKWEYPEMVREIERMAVRHGVDAILVEDKGQGTAYIQDRGSTEFQKRKAPAPVVAIQVSSNQGKEFRFDEITPMIDAGDVFIPQEGDWVDAFIREIGQFPDGAHDDQVDALSQFLRYVKTKRTRYGTRKVGSLG